MNNVTVFYYRHHLKYAQQFPTFEEALEYIEQEEDAGHLATHAIVDADRVYEAEEVLKLILDYEYKQAEKRKQEEMLKKQVQDTCTFEIEETKYLDFNGQKWELVD